MALQGYTIIYPPHPIMTSEGVMLVDDPGYTYRQDDPIMSLSTSLVCRIYKIRYTKNRSARVLKKLLKWSKRYGGLGWTHPRERELGRHRL